MKTGKHLTPEQIKSSRYIAEALASMPPDRFAVLLEFARAVRAGMEAQAQIDTGAELPKAAE